MKYLKYLIITFLFIIIPCKLGALTYNYDKDNNIVTINGKGEIIEYDSNLLSYLNNLPTSNFKKIIIGEGITSIGCFNWNLNKSFDEIVLPSTLTTIKAYTFSGKTNFIINIPESTTTIESGAFEKCTGLEEETQNTILSINKFAFKRPVQNESELYKKNSNKNISISTPDIEFLVNNFKEIRIDNHKLDETNYMLNQMDNNITIKYAYLNTLAEGVHDLEIESQNYFEKTILYIIDCSKEGNCNSCGEKAFWSYDNQSKTLTIKGVGNTKNYEYSSVDTTRPWNNFDINKVIVEEGIKGLGENAFFNSNLKEVSLPNTLETIGQNAFERCEYLENVVIPNSVTEIYGGAFKLNYSLKSVKLSNNLKYLSSSTFNGCWALEEIVIPEKVEGFGQDVFLETTNLKRVYMRGDAPNIHDAKPFPSKKEFRIYVPDNATGYDNDMWDRYDVVRYDRINKKRDFNVTIHNGYGNLDYNEGDIVNISPRPPHGKQFSYWRVDSENVELDNPNEENQTFIMPNGNVEITAICENAQSNGEDNIPPYVTDLRISKNMVYKPGIIDIEIDVIEEDSGISGASISYNKNDVSFANLAKNGTDVIEMSKFTGTIKFRIAVDSETRNGTYILNNITINDVRGNTSNYGVVKRGEKYYLYRLMNSYDNEEQFFKQTDSALIEVKDEYNISLDSTLTNPNLANRVAALKDNESARITIEGDSIIKKEVFDAIKGTNKRLILYQDAYEWIFKGTDIINETKDVNLKMSIGSVDGASLFTDKKVVSLLFQPNGLLPGPATIRLKSDYLYNLKGITGNLFLYYDLGDELEQIGEDLDLILDGSDKWVVFNITHNSKYFISGKKIHRKPTVRKSTVTGLGNKTYSGSYIKPKVTVKLNNKTLKLNTHYTVSYSNNKNVGLGKVVIKGKGSYIGSISKTFKINPKGTSISKITSGKKSFTIKWKKQATQTSGYIIQYSKNKSFKNEVINVTINKNKTLSKKISKLEPKKKYFVRVRTYKTVKGVKYYSSWSKVKSVTTK